MSNHVTEEMISAFIDGELSPEDKSLVENAISSDEALRCIYESYKESGSAIKASAEFVSGSVALPADFSSRVMAGIQATEKNESSQGSTVARNIVLDEAVDAKPTHAKPTQHDSPTPQTRSRVWSVRTVVEIVAATVAVVLIVVAFQGNGNHSNSDNVAKPDDSKVNTGDRPNNGVRALGNPNGDFNNSTNNKSPKPSNKTVSTSREFSIFVDAKTRPQVDRFWIMNDYEVGAPENADPRGDGSNVNVLLIDAKKADAVKFFTQLDKWDSKFKVFQQSKAGNASWLAPFDVSKAENAEGDFWTLQIVLIEK